jgi:leucyl-tRNA synthetase
VNDHYPHQEVEPKWQRIWEEKHFNEIDVTNGERKLYTLVMFSYPSGDRLHIGHWWNYGPTDTWARFKRMQGFRVFEPMGFDSFGLPAENYAVKHGVHPAVSTRKNIDYIMGQLKRIGAMYDWRYKLETSDPEYYKWTQWLFLTLFKNGYAYQQKAPVNWCDSCQTVLANEQVVNGTCERCGSEVIRRDMKQWFFRITDYAERLLEGLKDLDWPEKTKKGQSYWIGRSEGARIRFPIPLIGEEVEVFTTRPDTLYGVTYIVFAPEHALLERIVQDEQRAAVDAYIEAARKKNEIERTAVEKEKSGVFTGAYARHPLTGEDIPIWVADYVLASYGTGIVMAVPAHDERDFAFARRYGLPLKVVIQPSDGRALKAGDMEEAYTGEGIMTASGPFDGTPSREGIRKVAEHLEQEKMGGPTVTYRLRDWLISRQRYWGAPIPVVHCEKCGAVPVPEEDLPVLLPEDVDFRPRGKSPLASSESYMNTTCPRCGGPARRDPDTMDTFVCSSWYYLRYPSNGDSRQPWDPEITRKWLPVDKYVGGMEHCCGHLLYSRFITMVLHDLGYLSFTEPFTSLVHQGTITRNGDKMSKSRGNVVSPDDFVERYGADVFRMYMMFMGDYTEGGDWSDKGITGIQRFADRVWRGVKDFYRSGESPREEVLDRETRRLLHHTIQRVGRDLEAFRFNTAISRLMELLNTIYRLAQEGQTPAAGINLLLEKLVQLLAPFAPHLAEELWSRLGHEPTIFDVPWPQFDPRAVVAETRTIVVQINGKVRDKLDVPVDLPEDELKQRVLALDKVRKFTDGKEIKKLVVVPGRLVSLVVK